MSIMVVIVVVFVSAHRFLIAFFFAAVVLLFLAMRTRPFFVEAADMRCIVGAGFFVVAISSTLRAVDEVEGVD